LTGKPELPLYGLWDTINASGAIIREVMWKRRFRELKFLAMRFIWISITWKALDVLLGTRNISRIKRMVAN
jgi:hypothetical protein